MPAKLFGKERFELIENLKGDIQFSFQHVQGGQEEQFWRRVYVRAVFSYFEAHAFVMRSSCLPRMRPKRGDAEAIFRLALLTDASYQPTKTGRLERAREFRVPFVNSFAFSMRTFAEGAGLTNKEIERFFADNCFNLLQRATKVRDRLTHPKKLSDLDVSNDELLEVTNAYGWATQFIATISKKMLKRK